MVKRSNARRKRFKSYRKRITKKAVLRIVKKTMNQKEESTKIDQSWFCNPSDPKYGQVMYQKLDFPLANSNANFQRTFRLINANCFDSVAYPNNDARSSLSIVVGNKITRTACKLKVRIDPIWCTGTNFGSLTVNDGIPSFTSGSLMQNFPNACHTWIRLSILRAKRNVQDTSVDDYCQSLVVANGDFDLGHNTGIVFPLYDKRFKIDAATHTGLYVKPKLKRGSQRINKTFEPTNTGNFAYNFIDHGNLYMFVMINPRTFTDGSGTKWWLIPRFFVEFCEWFKDI